MPKPSHRPSLPRKPVWVTVFLAVLGAAGVWFRGNSNPPPADTETSSPKPGRASRTAAPEPAKSAKIDTLQRAIDNRENGVWVDGRGTLVKLLPDDHDGDRHQRLLVRLESSDTILIAHNIDVAPRVKADDGDEITFKGEFVWNERGGVVHWTHHDPKGNRTGGWIKARGKTYQ